MKGEERKLLEIFDRLHDKQQERLIAFAEFLAAGATGQGGAHEPLAIPREENETVALAIRRLVRTYPMLERRRLMGEASKFMAQHALDGRPASAVIDDLEVLFVQRYEQHNAQRERRKEKG